MGSNPIHGSNPVFKKQLENNPVSSIIESSQVLVPNAQNIIVKFRQYCVVDERLAGRVAKDYKNTAARFLKTYGGEISRDTVRIYLARYLEIKEDLCLTPLNICLQKVFTLIVNVAGIQMNPKILKKEENKIKCLELIQAAAKNGCQLLIFPECSLTGYCFSNLDEGLDVAEPIPGPSTNEIGSLCKEMGIYTILGLLEVDQNRCYNALAFLGPDGIVGKYRKIHLPYLGIDRYVTPGDQPYKVYTTDLGKIGINICFDARLPESARVMALMGAELIALPANWPHGAEAVPKYIINARAYENRVNYVAVNRVGVERGFRFIGRSKIVDYTGKTLKEASAVKEEIIYAQLDLEGPREKRIVIIPGEFELPLFEARRPEFYGLISR